MFKLININKSFGNNQLFKDFNCEIEAGKMTAIIGKSGSGKSTLLNIISTIEKVDSGDIFFEDTNISNVSKRKQKTLFKNTYGFIFQNYALVEEKTVKENILIGNDKITDEEINNVLKKVKLEGFADRIINSLSGGEQQRVAIARIIIKNPITVIADEPTGNLDLYNSEIIIDLFKDLKDKGITIIVATHDPMLMKSFDKVINLSY